MLEIIVLKEFSLLALPLRIFIHNIIEWYYYVPGCNSRTNIFYVITTTLPADGSFLTRHILNCETCEWYQLGVEINFKLCYVPEPYASLLAITQSTIRKGVYLVFGML